MGMFSMRSPRKYRRVSIYTDETQDKLRRIVDEARRSEGLPPEGGREPESPRFRGKFIQFTPRARRRKEGGARLGWPLALVLIAALLLVWRFLMTGSARF